VAFPGFPGIFASRKRHYVADEVQERTLVVLKPEALERGLTAKIMQRYLDKGLHLVHIEMKTLTVKQVGNLYQPHRGKSFYGSLIESMTRGPVLCLILEGNHAIDVVRRLHGVTDPTEGYAGTIRFDFGESKARNVVHGSDSVASANREIRAIFGNRVFATV
jgi:nucleoside-diphosphate kinase